MARKIGCVWKWVIPPIITPWLRKKITVGAFGIQGYTIFRSTNWLNNPLTLFDCGLGDLCWSNLHEMVKLEIWSNAEECKIVCVCVCFIPSKNMFYPIQKCVLSHPKMCSFLLTNLHPPGFQCALSSACIMTGGSSPKSFHVTTSDMFTTAVRLQNVSVWWLTYPSEKYEFVNWDDDIPNSNGKIKFMFQTTSQ